MKGIKSGTITGVFKGDTRSLDYGSYEIEYLVWLVVCVSRVPPEHRPKPETLNWLSMHKGKSTWGERV